MMSAPLVKILSHLHEETAAHVIHSIEKTFLEKTTRVSFLSCLNLHWKLRGVMYHGE